MASQIYVDADACPVKDEVVKVATRYGVNVHFVSDGGIRPHQSPLVSIVIVSQGPDAADNWIAETCHDGDIVVTSDIPLASRAVKNGALVLKPDGTVLKEESIGLALATRNLMTDLRETGEIHGGTRAFSKNDRSRFLQAMDAAIQSCR